MVFAEEVRSVESKRAHRGLLEFRERPFGVVERGVDRGGGERLQHREDDSFGPATLRQVVVNDCDAEGGGRGLRQH